MSDLMKRILADKARTRKELADLPFDQKLTIMEKMRERSAMLAENPLRKATPPTKTVAVVAGSVATKSTLDAS
jgi:hypothetical protein